MRYRITQFHPVIKMCIRDRKNISLNIDKVAGLFSKETIAAYEPQVKACMETLENGTGKGNDLSLIHI